MVRKRKNQNRNVAWRGLGDPGKRGGGGDLKPYFEEPTGKLYYGNVLDVLRDMPDDSVDMILTSPPYFGLRTYGPEAKQIWGGQIDKWAKLKPVCEMDCEHEWQSKAIKFGTKQHTGALSIPHRIKINLANKPEKVEQAFCLKCQAWYGELGLEPDFNLYLTHLWQICDELWRVLKPWGVMFWNMGDTYSGSYCGRSKSRFRKYLGQEDIMGNVPQTKILPKCLLMMPERFAMGLIERGWMLRNKICWQKPNPMPSSARDRFNTIWEYLYYFAKSSTAQYWTNEKTLELVSKQPAGISGKEKIDWKWRQCPGCEGVGQIIHDRHGNRAICQRCKGERRIKYSFWHGHSTFFDLEAIREPHKAVSIERVASARGRKTSPAGSRKIDHNVGAIPQRSSIDGIVVNVHPSGKNPGDFFSIITQPFPDAHFAVFPEALCEKPIKAGCPMQVCKKCGTPKERITRVLGKERVSWGVDKKARVLGKPGQPAMRNISSTTGWSKCSCNAGFRPGILLDPFCGAGTACVVAKKLGRHYIGIDCVKDYLKMSKKRLVKITAVERELY